MKTNTREIVTIALKNVSSKYKLNDAQREKVANEAVEVVDARVHRDGNAYVDAIEGVLRKLLESYKVQS